MFKMVHETDDQYFSNGLISNSFMKRFEISPAHGYTKKKKTKAMQDGSVFHDFLLLPNQFKEKYTIAPAFIENRKCREYNQLKAISDDKYIILNKEVDLFKLMKKEIYRHLNALNLLESFEKADKEISVYFDFMQEECSMKADALFIDHDMKYFIIFDPKSTPLCSRFFKDIYNLQYYRQAAFYKLGLMESLGEDYTGDFYFISSEKEPPHGVKIIRLTESYERAGLAEIITGINNIKQWKKDGADKTIIYKPEIIDVDKPYWVD